MPKKSTVKEKVDGWILRNGLTVKSNYDEILRLFETAYSGKFDHQILYKTVGRAFINRDAQGDLVKLYESIRAIGGITKEKLHLIYGDEDGEARWKSYLAKQSETNTLEYKQRVHGFTKEDFDKYNRSRSVTLANMISRHGEDEGRVRWDKYVNTQKYAGCALQYFIDVYGEEAGTEKYKETNRAKSQSLSYYIERYGEEDGANRFEKRAESIRTGVGYSMVSQEMFTALDAELVGLNLGNIYYFTKNKECGKMNIPLRKYFSYDFVIPNIKLVVEFNGDLYHANPRKYRAEDVPKFPGNDRTSKDIWEYDRVKLDTIRGFGFDVVVVWEYDYRNDPKGTVNDILQYIYKRN